MNAYEQKQAARKARLEDRAEKLASQADARFNSASSEVAGIPFGQPILVGHHSESRHRNALKRHDQKMRKGLELQQAARDAAGRAESVGKAGISSDDPEAVEKLTERLAVLEARRALYKALNNAHKAYLKDPATLEANKSLTATYKTMVRDYKPAYSWEPHPIAPYQFGNLSAEIRRVKQRIEILQAAAARPAVPDVEGEGFRIVQNVEDNRVQIFFDGKPAPEIRKHLKAQGFRWAPSVGAWQRQLNGNGLWAARCMLKILQPEETA